VVELRCTYDAGTRGGSTPDGRKVKGTIQWVSAPHALPAEVRLFERLFLDAELGETELDEKEGDLTAAINPSSLTVIPDAKVEPSVARDAADTRYQFERTGYFWRDPVDTAGEALVFNRIVPLKDTWSRREPAAVRPPAPPLAERPRGPQMRPKAPQPREERQPRREVNPERQARFERYRSEFGVIDEHAELLASSPGFFEDALEEHADATAVAAWIVVDLRGLLEGRSLDELNFGGQAVGRLAALVDEGKVSRRAAKDVLARMVAEGGDPDELVESMGLEKMSDPDELGAIVDTVLAEWPDKVSEYREGKKSLIGLFVGEVMKQTGGAADPATAKSLLVERLGA